MSGVYCLCAVKPRQTLLSCTKYRTKIRWNLKSRSICLRQNIARPQKLAWCKSPFNARSTSWKPAANVRLLLRFHAAVSVGREQHALQSLALAVVSVCFFRAVTLVCVYGTIAFCLVFSKNFNIITALSVNQSPILPQKIDSRGGLFRCKKGLHVNVGKMNFY